MAKGRITCSGCGKTVSLGLEQVYAAGMTWNKRGSALYCERCSNAGPEPIQSETGATMYAILRQIAQHYELRRREDEV